MSEYGYITHSELMHHGIKGQKWGVRRYQNADGSYRPGAEGRYYHPIRRLVRKINSLPRNVTDFFRPSEKQKRKEKIMGTVPGKIASGAKVAAGYGVENTKDAIKEKLSSGKEKKMVDKNSYAYKKAKYDRAAAIATSAITAASIAGMGALMVNKSLKNKKAVHNAMLKLVDNKIGGTLDEAAYNLFEKNYRYSIGRNGRVSDHARSYLINNGVKGTINRNAQLLKKKKR